MLNIQNVPQLNAINDLKVRRDNNEGLEVTQIAKIKSEETIRKELDKLLLESGQPVGS